MHLLKEARGIKMATKLTVVFDINLNQVCSELQKDLAWEEKENCWENWGMQN